jgi:hypothetical protein
MSKKYVCFCFTPGGQSKAGCRKRPVLRWRLELPLDFAWFAFFMCRNNGANVNSMSIKDGEYKKLYVTHEMGK